MEPDPPAELNSLAQFARLPVVVAATSVAGERAGPRDFLRRRRRREPARTTCVDTDGCGDRRIYAFVMSDRQPLSTIDCEMICLMLLPCNQLQNSPRVM